MKKFLCFALVFTLFFNPGLAAIKYADAVFPSVRPAAAKEKINVTKLLKIEGSKVVAESGNELVLTSGKPFSEIVAYYESALQKLGAKASSKSKTGTLFAYDGVYGEQNRPISIAIVGDTPSSNISISY